MPVPACRIFESCKQLSNYGAEERRVNDRVVVSLVLPVIKLPIADFPDFTNPIAAAAKFSHFGIGAAAARSKPDLSAHPCQSHLPKTCS